jgi:hypothetical protein
MQYRLFPYKKFYSRSKPENMNKAKELDSAYAVLVLFLVGSCDIFFSFSMHGANHPYPVSFSCCRFHAAVDPGFYLPW